MTHIDNETKDKIIKNGSTIRKALYASGYDNKIEQITHQLLVAVRLQNRTRFMDVLLHTHMMLNRTLLPEMALMDDETFNDIGYAFVTGMMTNFKKENETETEK